MPTITHPRDFTAERAWGAFQIAQLDGVTVRLHWTDAPYHWYVNDGLEEGGYKINGQCIHDAPVTSMP